MAQTSRTRWARSKAVHRRGHRHPNLTQPRTMGPTIAIIRQIVARLFPQHYLAGNRHGSLIWPRTSEVRVPAQASEQEKLSNQKRSQRFTCQSTPEMEPSLG